MNQLIYVMDPMCSWCWAFSPVMAKLKASYPDLPVKILMGGLAADSDIPMPIEMREKIQQIWRLIEEKTGTRFNHDFWQSTTPKRSTYPACRAVITCEDLKQGEGEKMAAAIQHAYYLQARNPSEETTLCDLAEKLGIKQEKFLEHLHSAEVETELLQQISFAHSLGAQGFPSLFLQINQQIMPLTYGYCSFELLEGRIEKYL